MPRDQAVKLGLSSTADADDDEPAQRQESCLEIAAFLYGIGDQAGLDELEKESERSIRWGRQPTRTITGQHLAEWLARSITQADAGSISRFSIGLHVSSKSQGAAVGQKEQRRYFGLLVRLNPARAWQLAVEYIDRRVLKRVGCARGANRRRR